MGNVMAQNMAANPNGHPKTCTCPECMAYKSASRHDHGMVAMSLDGVAAEGLSKKDIYARLAEHDIMDELMVADKYLDYSYAFSKEHCEDLARTFADMAEAEYHHAHIERDILLEAGYSMTEDGECMFKDLKERFEHMFR